MNLLVCCLEKVHHSKYYYYYYYYYYYHSKCRYTDNITDALVSLHWLQVPERIQYKIAVLTYKVLHGTAPWYLGPLDWVADLHGRRALRCASSSRLVVPMFWLYTVGSGAFNVSGPLIWNELPEGVVSAPTFWSFRHRLKNPSSFSSHILILSSNCTFDTIVDLVVMFIT